MLAQPPSYPFAHPELPDFDIYAAALRALLIVGGHLMGDDLSSDDVLSPAGWSEDDLLAEAMRTMGVAGVIE